MLAHWESCLPAERETILVLYSCSMWGERDTVTNCEKLCFHSKIRYFGHSVLFAWNITTEELNGRSRNGIISLRKEVWLAACWRFWLVIITIERLLVPQAPFFSFWFICDETRMTEKIQF